MGVDLTRALTFRRLRAGERRPIIELFEGMSDRSRSARFHGPKRELSERDLEQLAAVGCCGREAVVAVEQEHGRPVGIARFVRDANAPEAEIAFEVVDEWQGRGLGKQLLAELRLLARDPGILRFRAEIAHGNTPAFALVRGLGDELTRSYEDGNVKLVVRLP
jgi:RimJ/RimL family protein N-acetyltransferase